MLIDIHVHCCKARHPGITRADGGTYPTPERLIGMMDENGINKAVVQTTLSSESRYTMVTVEETVEICERYPDRLIPFANLDPRFIGNNESSDFSSLLQAYKEMGCRGIGECIANIPFNDPLAMSLFRQVERAGLPLTFHVAPQKGDCYGFIDEVGLPRLERVLAAFPDLVFLGHSQPFWAEIGTNLIENGERISYPTGPVRPGRLVELMRKYPNLHGDLSAGSGYTAISRDPEFGDAFLEEFQDRLCFGTDIAHMKQELPIVDYFHSLKTEGRLSKTAWENIAWRNADRILELGVGRHE